MANLNKVMLIGNLTRDPELRYTPKGTAVGDIGLAVNRRVKDANDNWTDETTFIDITLWGRDAENAQKFLSKGRAVFIEGRLQLDTWEDKQTGQKRSKLKVVGESLQFMPDAKQAESSERARRRPSDAASSQSPSSTPADDAGFDDEGDDIPF